MRNISATFGFILIVCSAVPVIAQLTVNAALLGKIEKKYDDDAVIRVQQWQALIKTARHLPELEKLQKVNMFFNRQIEFADDIYVWNKKDYWATPLEFLGRGAGDCEDYSIAKYFTLKELGVSEKKLRITYVKALKLKQAHMVLTYFDTPRSVPLVLDNIISKIKPATQRKDLAPVYSFNGLGLWLAKSKGSGKKVGSASRLNKWEGLKKRILNKQS